MTPPPPHALPQRPPPPEPFPSSEVLRRARMGIIEAAVDAVNFWVSRDTKEEVAEAVTKAIWKAIDRAITREEAE